jgi:mRNA interferase RelE/StbE
MSFKVEWSNSALNDLNKLGIILQKRIFKKIDYFANESSFHEVKKVLGYEKTYRLRVGDYRIIFEIEKDRIIILKVGHRKDIY